MVTYHRIRRHTVVYEFDGFPKSYALAFLLRPAQNSVKSFHKTDERAGDGREAVSGTYIVDGGICCGSSLGCEACCLGNR